MLESNLDWIVFLRGVDCRPRYMSMGRENWPVFCHKTVFCTGSATGSAVGQNSAKSAAVQSPNILRPRCRGLQVVRERWGVVAEVSCPGSWGDAAHPSGATQPAKYLLFVVSFLRISLICGFVRGGRKRREARGKERGKEGRRFEANVTPERWDEKKPVVRRCLCILASCATGCLPSRAA